MDIRRDEFNRLIDLLNERGDTLKALLGNQEIQFTTPSVVSNRTDLQEGILYRSCINEKRAPATGVAG
jgi:hypothetical protein